MPKKPTSNYSVDDINKLNPSDPFLLPGNVIIRKRSSPGRVIARYGKDGELPVPEPPPEPESLPPYPVQDYADADAVVVYDDEPAYEVYKRAMAGDVLAREQWNFIRELRLSAAQSDPPATDRMPAWNADRRELVFRDVLVKRFRQPAKNQERVLSAFQEEDWPQRILNPLPPSVDLNNTLRRLNCNDDLAFRADGTGEGILWEPKRT